MQKTILFEILSLILVSCVKLTDPVIIDLEDSYLSGPGVYVLNEGNFRSGNGSLSFYSYDSAKLYNHVFESVNQRPLGDVPYSMTISGNRAYIVVNNSGKVEVVDRNYIKSVATITDLPGPRYITFVTDNKAYITNLYSDSITVVDPASNTISGYIDLKHPSEAMAVSYSKAFAAHWAGGNKVFVIETTEDRVTDSIEVGAEPESMVTDYNGLLWVLCNGGWQREHFAELVAINTFNNAIEKRFVFPSITDSPSCLRINGTGEILYYLHGGVRRMNINAAGLPESAFINDLNQNFYKLGINPVNNDIFVTDAADYQRKGSLLRFNKEGALLSMMEAGIIPGELCFKVTSDPVIY